MASHQFSEEKVDDYKAAFHLFDKDKDGTINKEDLANMLKQLGDEATDQDVTDMLKEVDMSGSGV